MAALSLAIAAQAQIGEPYIHDPSTLAECDGKYYTFGTGGGGLISDDGWSWHSGADRPGGGAAPDVLKIGDRYLCIYGATGGGLGGGHAGRILTMWNKTLDPKSPDFKWSEAVEVCYSDGMEDQDAIDPGLLLDPTTGRLWVSYGTYFGTIRLIELDPKTGFRVKGNQEKDIAIDCEASDLMYRDGWYYLLGTHGTCCDGVNSTYNIVVGRSKSVEGPYLDNVGRDMFHGGGKMVIAAEKRACGAGHFGRYIIDEGVEVMSFHWEADFELSGRSTLAVRPLVWKNGWPVAGENFKGGSFEIESERRGYALELAVDFIRMKQERQGWFNREQMQQPAKPIANQTLADVIGTWPEGVTLTSRSPSKVLTAPSLLLPIVRSRLLLPILALTNSSGVSSSSLTALIASCRKPSLALREPIRNIVSTAQVILRLPSLNTILVATIPNGTSAATNFS